jgi:hypothetical protein
MNLHRASSISLLAGFGTIFIFSWIDEIFDLPHLLLGAPATPINWRESLLESVFVAIVGLVFWRIVHRYENRVRRHLEGFHSICSYCHQVKEQEHWVQLETWLSRKSDATLTHGICPHCLKKNLPKVYEGMVKDGLIEDIDKQPVPAINATRAETPRR